MGKMLPAAVLSGLVALQGLIAVPAQAATAPPCSNHTQDSTSAAAMAHRCSTRVEVDSARTETGQVFAEPDGTRTVEEFAYPQRVRRPDGSWSSLDSTLAVNADGTLSPRASTVDVAFSAGGAGPLITAQRHGKRMSLTWPGPLPAPIVAGATATYPGVLDGVDLVVTAQDTGFSEVLVVHDAAAAANPKLHRISLGASTTGLHWNASDGRLHAVDAQGATIFSASRPMMWDSSDMASNVRGPGRSARTAPLELTVDSGQMTVTPDAALLADPAVKYPLYLDPTVGYSNWTMINSQFTTQSYWSYDKQDCPPAYNGGWCAKVGQIYGGTMDYRSIWSFSTSSIHGYQVIPTNTKFSIDLLHSAYCTGSTTELHTTGVINSSTTWSNNAGTWSGVIASVSNQDCGDGRVVTEIAGGSLVSTLQSLADAPPGTMTWGLKAATETSDSGWKKFDATTAKLVVTTNAVPNVPDTLTVDGKSCAAGPSRPFIATATPVLKSRVTDPDPSDMLDDWFAYAKWGLTDVPLTADVNSDGKSDATIWRPSDGKWYERQTGVGDTTTGAWGVAGDKPMLADFSGDGKADQMIWRPSEGKWYLWTTGVGGSAGVAWGINGDVPLAADFSGDGKADAMIFRPSDGTWWLWTTGGSQVQWLSAFGVGDTGLAGDVNGDGKADALYFHPADGSWHVAYTGGSTATLKSGFGAAGDVPLADDFNGDHKTDVAYFHPADGSWHVAYTGGSTATLISNWGGVYGDVALTGDYNGDGKADGLFFRPGNGTGDGSWNAAYTGGSATVLTTNWGGLGSFVDAGGGHQTPISNGGYGQITTTTLQEGAIYTFRSQSNDGPSSGHPGYSSVSPVTNMPGNCEFQVDLTDPTAPTVTSDVYVEGCGSCGSVGQTGRFTFQSSPDVVAYKWGWSDPPSTVVNPAVMGDRAYVDWTPTTGGAKTLYVAAVDRAGRSTRKVYQFYVAPPSNAVARWKLNESSGTALSDDTGGGHTATLTGSGLGAPGRIVGGDTALQLSAGSYATAPSVVDTSKSFTVSAWAKLDNLTSRHPILVANGSDHSAFYLWYTTAYNRWVFETTTADGTSYSWNTVTSDSPPKAGVWTHLVGVFDSGAQTLRLYVNGVQQTATKTGVTGWNATNGTVIGRTTAGDSMAGSIAGVQLWNRVVSATEITDMVDPLKGALVGRWDMSTVGPGPEYDSSGYFHDLNFYAGAQIPPSGSGHTGTGLKLGAGAYAATDLDPTYQQVLHTDQSFTVSAWLWIDTGTAMTSNKTALAQDGAYQSAFFLGYRQVGGVPKWCFALPDTDVAGPTWNSVSSAATLTASDQGKWVHLVAVYDAQSGAMRLYVDNALVGSGTRTVSGWDAAGRMTFGAALWTGTGGTPVLTDLWPGSIDEVRAYQGVVTDVSLIS